MQNIGELIRSLRKKEGFPLRKVAAFLDIDQAILSKIERGQRKLSKEQVIKLAGFFNYNEKEMLITFLSDRIIYEIGSEDYAIESLKVAEEKIEYFSRIKLSRSEIIEKIKNYFINERKILKAWLFGSFARGDDDYKSDIDLMIQVKDDSGFSLFDLAEIQYQLEKNIPYKIDVVMRGGIKPNIMDRIKKDLELIYER
ncbi:MAG: nucleotidyltransferase domain-containing protein [Bacteroidales bacterium]|nr:nucleotidyltransferase domain-containing protein [Bacteroidales bacterium]